MALSKDVFSAFEDVVVRVAVDESVDLLGFNKLEAMVLCGTKDEDECLMMESLE